MLLESWMISVLKKNLDFLNFLIIRNVEPKEINYFKALFKNK